MTERKKSLQVMINIDTHTLLWDEFARLRKGKKNQGIVYTVAEFVEEIILKSLA